MRHRLALSLTVPLLFPALACQEEPPSGPSSSLSPVLRLWDGSVAAEVELSAPSESWAGDLVRARLGGLPAEPNPVVRVELEPEGWWDHRLGLLATTPSSYRFHVQVPDADTHLRTSLGWERLGARIPMAIEYRITATPTGQPSRDLLWESVISQPGAGAEFNPVSWEDRTIDLSSLRGQEVTLEFQTRIHGQESLALPAVWGAPSLVVADAPHPPVCNFLLISLDTLRADRLGCYGYSRPTSPNLDAFAEHCIRFESVISPATWTVPSHLALFTGRYPNTSRQPSVQPLAMKLWAEGYATRAITAGGFLHPRYDTAYGFEQFQKRDWARDLAPIQDTLHDVGHQPFFLFLHTYEIHEPYRHAELARSGGGGRLAAALFNSSIYDQLGQELTEQEKLQVSDLYDSGIRFVDAQLGLLFRELARRGLLDDTVIAITSDHGEEFWEHDQWGHAREPYEHQIRVPWILYLPESLRREWDLDGPPGQVIEDTVELVDLYPTILELLGVKLTHDVHGDSLVPLLRGEEMRQRPAFTSASRRTPFNATSIRTEQYKLITFQQRSGMDTGGAATPASLLFDLQQDPGELHSIAEQEPEVASELLERMRRVLPVNAAIDVSPSDPLTDQKLLEELQALGYTDR